MNVYKMKHEKFEWEWEMGKFIKSDRPRPIFLEGKVFLFSIKIYNFILVKI